jgi:hypothetical protein
MAVEPTMSLGAQQRPKGITLLAGRRGLAFTDHGGQPPYPVVN